MASYEEMYRKSIDDPSSFWGEIAAAEMYWKVPPRPDKFLQYNFDIKSGPVSINWMKGAVTNVCYNVLDRNVLEKGRGDKIAFYW